MYFARISGEIPSASGLVVFLRGGGSPSPLTKMRADAARQVSLQRAKARSHSPIGVLSSLLVCGGRRSFPSAKNVNSREEKKRLLKRDRSASAQFQFSQTPFRGRKELVGSEKRGSREQVLESSTTRVLLPPEKKGNIFCLYKASERRSSQG